MTQAALPDRAPRDGGRSGRGSQDRVWTLPNVISFARLVLLLPLTVWLLVSGHLWWSLVALVVLSGSDWLDGYLARRLGQVSLLGKRLDPVADRISIVVVTLALVITRVLPWPAVAVILAVDLVLLVLAAVWFRGSPDLPVSRIGKWRTAALLAGLPVLIVSEAAGWEWLHVVGIALIWLGVVGHVLAGVGYARGMARARRRRGRQGTTA